MAHILASRKKPVREQNCFVCYFLLVISISCTFFSSHDDIVYFALPCRIRYPLPVSFDAISGGSFYAVHFFVSRALYGFRCT